ncbi:hypothetical protein DERP_004795 [Dermatophagoides pteronyssinus]|uniref:Uncharacterized protein n=1 Tax=Dermatophagoides pteronyssinus TaxID=6956 RepID=A0ABQ8JSJ8_DERPT|nr:hypothetical protein DERP_004795 [Dermatophagoides pteronyssinus]
MFVSFNIYMPKENFRCLRTSKTHEDYWFGWSFQLDLSSSTL